MLKIINSKLKTKKSVKIDNLGNDMGKTRHYPPATQEWFNSVYAFNKNTIKLLPVADLAIISLMKSYFNLYNKKLERKIRFPRLRVWNRRLSTNRILVSKAELKHTSNKIIITLYTYNRQRIYLLNKLKKIVFFKYKFVRYEFFKLRRFIKRQTKLIIFNVITQKNLLFKTLKFKNNNFKNYQVQYYKKFIYRVLRKKLLYILRKKAIYINKFKFNSNYLIPLKSLIEKIYKKKVEFNIINLKYYHLNSDIFSDILYTKLRNRKNRVLRVLKLSLQKIKIQPIDNDIKPNSMSSKVEKIKNIKLNHLLFDGMSLNIKSYKKDILNRILRNNFKKSIDYISDKSIHNTKVESLSYMGDYALNSIKHKLINGIRIKASGRLTKRITAERAISKLRYIGGIKNADYSREKISSVLLRGHFRSNLQYTKLKSKTRIGSFGLKGWISSE